MASELKNPWAGRFREAMSERLVRFGTSLPLEGRLFPADVRASRAHVQMLAQVGLLAADEAAVLLEGLDGVLADFEAGTLVLEPELEDIHMNLEVALVRRVGEVAKKVHTARSRNDQQAVAQRLYFKESTLDLAARVTALMRALRDHARAHAELLMPSYTHLQRAEFTRYGHWASTYVVMLARDRARLRDCVARADACPLGACASTGTSLPIDRALAAKLLGFPRPTLHAIDSVSDRDYLVELGSAAALLMVHLSRLSEEIIAFVSQEFGFLELADALCTGSSIMPQKKNPDVLELVRGKAATVIGNATSLLALMKALPLGYNKDTQEDKAAWFSALDACVASVDILADVIATARPRAEVMARAARGGHVLATEYANYLVRRGLPFREAHAVVGGLVREAVERGVDVSELPLEAFERAHALFEPDVRRLDPAEVVRRKDSAGSCGDAAMRALFDELEALIAG